MQRDRWVQLSWGGVMAIFLAGSMLLTPMIAASAGTHKLVYADRAEEGDPPQVALGIAMGAFRGLFVNMLWMRANDLKEEGKYYEAVDLAEAITQLQPRFPRVWSFHAWNLAYNISVATNTPEERWEWVKAGIELLRSKGIPANPNDMLLHKELAWIFAHKVQGVMDDANWYYKRQFADEWNAVIGPPNRVAMTKDGKAEMLRLLNAIDQAPPTLTQVYETNPKAQEIVIKLRQAGVDLDVDLLRTIELFNRVADMYQQGIQIRLSENDRAVYDLLLNSDYNAAWNALIPHIRKRLLKDEYHMEIERMIRYTQRYGPLDWRHPSAHALYWSERGVEEGLARVEERNQRDFDFLNTDRITLQAVQELARSGTIFYDPINPQGYRQRMNIAFVDAYEDKITEVADREVVIDPKTNKVINLQSKPWTLYNAGYLNFLKDTIRYLYRKGDVAKAREYYTKLQTFKYINHPGLGLHTEAVGKPLDDFVRDEIIKEDRFTSPYVALQEVGGALEAAFTDGLLLGDPEAYENNMQHAVRFYNVFKGKQSFKTGVNRYGNARLDVFGNWFDVYAGQEFAYHITSFGQPDGPLMYSRAPNDLKRWTYYWLARSPIRTQLDQAAMAQGQELPEDDSPSALFNTWFPPPDGYKQYAQQTTQRLQSLQNRAEGVEIK